MWKSIERQEAKELAKTPHGRPLRWEKPEDMIREIEKYSEDLKERQAPFTVAGLAAALDVDVETLRNYAEKDAFFRPLKRALRLAQARAEEYLYSGKNPAGVIFLMKNHWQYKDTQDVVHHKETINDLLQKTEHREIIEGEVVDDVPLLAQPSEE